MANKTWKGTVYQYHTDKRIPYCLISVYAPGGEAQIKQSDDDGDFIFEELDEEKKWKARILHQEHFAETLELELKDNTNTTSIKMHKICSTQDESKGRWFLTICSIALLVLAGLYIYLHYNLSSANKPLSYEFKNQLETLKHDHQKYQDELSTTLNDYKDKLHQIGNKLKLDPEKVSTTVSQIKKTHIGLSDSLSNLITVLSMDFKDPEMATAVSKSVNHFTSHNKLLRNGLSKNDTLFKKMVLSQSNMSSTDKDLMIKKWTDISAQIKSNNVNELNGSISGLLHNIENPNLTGFISWTKSPWFMFEIFLWALMGILAAKIIEAGYYLRRCRFYKEGIFMHVSQLIAIPFMVLVTMMVLSLVSFQINIPGNDGSTAINLSNPIILAAISFILAFRPWGVRRFIFSANDRLTGGDQNNDDS